MPIFVCYMDMGKNHNILCLWCLRCTYTILCMYSRVCIKCDVVWSSYSGIRCFLVFFFCLVVLSHNFADMGMRFHMARNEGHWCLYVTWRLAFIKCNMCEIVDTLRCWWLLMGICFCLLREIYVVFRGRNQTTPAAYIYCAWK